MRTAPVETTTGAAPRTGIPLPGHPTHPSGTVAPRANHAGTVAHHANQVGTVAHVDGVGTVARRADRAGTRVVARLLRGAAVLVGTGAAGWATAWLLGRAAEQVAGNKHAPWIVGRASGITAYLLLTLVVAMGLVLAHPWRSRLRRPSTVARIRAHVVLTVFTLAFTVLHVVVLATDTYAGVGWRGALLPLGAQFRPVPVTLGVIGLYAGLLAGLTAALAGRLPLRVWWPVHKVSGAAFVLVWVHGLLAGSDSAALRLLYAAGGTLVIGLAVSRYAATSPADRLAELSAAARPTMPVRGVR